MRIPQRYAPIVFGALLSALFLGESIFEWKYVLALLLVCLGIWRVTRRN